MGRGVLARLAVFLSAFLALPPGPLIPAHVSDPPVIAAAGDIACQSDTPTATECHQLHTSDILVGGAFDAVLTLGDNQYPIGGLDDFQTYYHPTWGRVKEITHPSVGDNEYDTPGAAGYFEYFGPAAGAPSTGYYSFDLGSWHLVALNSSCSEVGGCHAGSPQEQWLRADLAAHHNVCTLAYWHHPRFSSGSVHGSDPEMQAFWQALYDFRADVVLNGHVHNYERFAPQTPAAIAEPNGIRQFVVGTGGRSHYGFGEPLGNSVIRHSGTFGVLVLTLHPTSYEWEFVPETGQTFTDSGSALCTGDEGPGQPSPQPGSDVRKDATTLSLDVTSRRILPGRRTTLIATVPTCQGREADLVDFQRHVARTWRSVGTEPLGVDCTARLRVKLRHTASFRAAVPESERYLGDISNLVRVKVKRPPGP